MNEVNRVPRSANPRILVVGASTMLSDVKRMLEAYEIDAEVVDEFVIHESMDAACINVQLDSPIDPPTPWPQLKGHRGKVRRW